LPAEELDLLVRASVVGQEVSRGALAELVDDPRQLDPILDALTRKDLLVPVTSTYAEEAYRFWHALVRDAAYAASLKEVRADLHERFARWLARTTGDRAGEYEEIVGYHLEQAHHLRVEIAPGDPAAARLAADAARALGDAGRRAIGRGDTHAAEDLLTRASALEPDSVRRAELLVHLADARLHGGDPPGAHAVAEEALAAAQGRDRAVELRARLRIGQIELYVDPSVDHLEFAAAAEAAAAELEQLGDLSGAAAAWQLQVYTAMAVGYAELVRAAGTARRLARRAGDTRVEAEALGWEGWGIAVGPMPVREAIEYCERMRAESSGPLAQAYALHPTSWLYALADRIDKARAAGDRAAQIFHELGLEYWAHGVALPRAWAERLAGDRAREEKLLRNAVTGLQSIGDATFLSSFAAELALTLAETGRPEEALEWAELSRTNTAETDLDAQVQWRHARAEALTALGELEEAEQLARQAVELVFRRDSPILRGQILVALAEVLQAAGTADEAHATAERALEQIRRKGSDLAFEQARRRLETARSGVET
jgi:tetratricopeptide (TPR) repeat protein